MNTRSALRTILLIASAAACTSVSAQIINVDFNIGSSTTFYDNFGGSPSSPVPGTGPYWNGISITGENQFAPGSFASNATLLASDGVTITSAGFSLTFGGAYNENPFPSEPTYRYALLADYAYTASGVSRTLTLTGLSSNTDYELYLYAQNTSYRNAATTFSVTATYSSTGSALSQTATNSGTGDAFSLNNNYIRFTTATSNALRSDGSGQIVLDWVGAGAEGTFNGFQLITIPEPSTAALVALLVPGLLVFRKRSRR